MLGRAVRHVAQQCTAVVENVGAVHARQQRRAAAAHTGSAQLLAVLLGQLIGCGVLCGAARREHEHAQAV